MGSYLGIDLGTSAAKAVLVDGTGRVLARARAEHGPPAGTGRADPAAWARSVQAACRALGDAAAGAGAVGIAAHCPVAVPMDACGEALAPALRWDHPALPPLVSEYAALRTRHEAALVGNAAHPATSMALAWRFLAEHEPGTAGRTRTLGSAGAWLGHRLTGRTALDPTQASYTGLLDCTGGSRDWLPGLATRAGVPPRVLPPVRPSLSVLGRLLPGAAAALGLRAGVPVAVGAADTAAAAHLLRMHDGGAPLYTVGTTHVVTRCAAAPDPEPLVLQRPHTRPGQWLRHAVTNGGLALAAASRSLGYGGAVERMVADAAAAGAEQAAAAPVHVPHVTPERGPLWTDRPHTAFVGRTSGIDARAAAWGAVEGVAFAVRLAACMGAAGDGPVLLAGAPTPYPQLAADLLGRPVDLVGEPYLPGVGAAAMAAEAADGVTVPAPPSRRVAARPGWPATVEARWARFAEVWSRTVGRPFPAAAPGT